MTNIDVFINNCADAQKALIDGMCFSEEVTATDIAKRIKNGDQSTVFELAKRFAKVANDQKVPDVDTGDVQETCNILELLIECCEENNWFGY